MKAALYLRVSTDAQADKDLSLPAQEAQLKAVAADKGWEVAEVFREAGKTGTNDARPQLQALLAAATSKKPPFDIVMVYAVDRFGRGPADPLNAQRMLDNGVRLFSKYENGFADENWLLFSIQNVMAQNYSRKLSVDVPRGQRESVSQGKGHGAGRRDAFGYREDRELDGAKVRTRLVIDKRWSPYAKQLFERYADGDSTRHLARWLNEQKVPTAAQRRGLKPRGKTHGLWLQSTVLKILRNPIYTGYITVGRLSVRKLQTGKTRTTRNAPDKWAWSPEPTHQAIITKELFKRVQDRMAGNKQFRAREGRPINLIQELGRCGACGSSLSFEDNGPKNGSKMYYFCRAYRRHKKSESVHAGPKCAGGFPMDVVDQAMFAFLEASLNKPKLIEASVRRYNEDLKITEEPPELVSLEARVVDLRQKIENLLDQAESGALIKDRLGKRQVELQAAQDDLSEAKAKQKSSMPLDARVIVATGKQLLVHLEHGDRDAVKRLLPHLVTKVNLDFTKRQDATKFWRLDLLEGAKITKTEKPFSYKVEMSAEAGKKLQAKAQMLAPAAIDAIRVYLRYDPRNLSETLGEVGKFIKATDKGIRMGPTVVTGRRG